MTDSFTRYLEMTSPNGPHIRIFHRHCLIPGARVYLTKRVTD